MSAKGATSRAFHTAVLLLIFNRPETTGKVFETLRRVRPPRLYVASDGPRVRRKGEIERVANARELATAVDWPCQLHTLFRDHNLGCKRAVSEAITWFFEKEEEGVILEDDCLPHLDFYHFSEALLARYRDDERVFAVTGDNFQDGWERNEGSYYFSRYNHVWGWASWRRAWEHYDGDLSFWPEWKKSRSWLEMFSDTVERRFWEGIFDRTHAGGFESWAYPWTASVWFHGGLTTTPNVNLVSNIGFGSEATHTTSAGGPLADLPVRPLGELRHPARVERDPVADRYVFENTFGGRHQRFPWALFRLPHRAGRFLYRRIKRRLT